ncbi:MAG TPA: YncE family protein [Candidatus Acidoferrales bacterium]|nr:YncE family protein [Candidatus Acidoferrales bacterium]
MKEFILHHFCDNVFAAALIALLFTVDTLGPRALYAQKVMATIPTGALPTDVVVNPVTDKIYVSNTYDSTVTVIDGARNSTATIHACFAPQMLVVNPAMNRIYAAGSESVTVIDGATDDTIDIPVPADPIAMALNPVPNRLYIVCRNFGQLVVIDGKTNAVSFLPVGGSPVTIAANMRTNMIYIGGISVDSSLIVLDCATGRMHVILDTIIVYGITVDPAANKIYVSCAGRRTNSPEVLVVDCSTGTFHDINYAAVDNPSIALNPATGKVYVADRGSSDIKVIDGATYETTTLTGGAGQGAMAVDEALNRIYIANSNDNTVTVLDGRTNGITTLRVGTKPVAIAVNSVTHKVYVVNQYDNTVTVIDGR